MQTCRRCKLDMPDDYIKCPRCDALLNTDPETKQELRDLDLADIARTARAVYTILMVQAVLAALFFAGMLWLWFQSRRLLY